MAKVKLENITRQFDRLIAIEDISFEVPDGQFWVLVGPSGCGKSTILRTIAGLDSATSGQLYIDDTLVNDLPARQRDVAMVFQNYALYPHMSVADNLAFGLRMRNVDKAQINGRVQEVARALNIEHLLKRKPKQLSGGQQQRVALGRAIARQPKVFLLDEPLSNLDAQLRDDTRAELKQLHDRVGITTIYVTHDQIEAMTLADRLVVLNEGKIQQIGSPQAIYAQPANRMVAAFLGSPPMNILPATFADGNFRLHHQSIPVPEIIKQQLKPDRGQNFELGIRPEHIFTASTHSTSEQTASVIVEIDLIEPLGKEILVRANLPDSNLVVNFSTPAQWQGKKGDRLSVELDLAHLFVFEPDRGQTLYPIY
ncbi:MAG: sn-glycerol-3-phosphate ABC transporter ATP-binding protein UgpC [Xenococcaceae cyanobacterium MO_188.B32]|nr:sn-glycerol-3-phosphate ABC transporter ATP-binding protein UgpC [Xenococcaceae cyanobacterium MO_188.B32]